MQVNPVIGTEDSVYEFFIKIRDYDGEPLQAGYPRIWIRNPATGQLVNLGGHRVPAVMVPFEVDGSTLGETSIGRNLDPASLTPPTTWKAYGTRYVIPGPAIGEQLGILPRLPNPVRTLGMASTSSSSPIATWTACPIRAAPAPC